MFYPRTPRFDADVTTITIEREKKRREEKRRGKSHTSNNRLFQVWLHKNQVITGMEIRMPITVISAVADSFSSTSSKEYGFSLE